MSERDDLPEPGTPEAMERGCCCEYRDGEPQDNDRWPMWLVRRCPVHRVILE